MLEELSAEGARAAKRQPADLPFRICQPADAGDADPRGARGDFPVALRGVRVAGIGGDAARHPGGDVAAPPRCPRSPATRRFTSTRTTSYEIAQAIKTITADEGLRAELSRRGRVQAELFSVARYRERVAALYERLG